MSVAFSRQLFNSPIKLFLSICVGGVALLTVRSMHSLFKRVMFEFTDAEMLTDPPPMNEIGIIVRLLLPGAIFALCAALLFVLVYGLVSVLQIERKNPGYVGNLWDVWISFFSAAHRYYYARITLSVAAALLSCVLVYLLYAFIASVVNSFALMQNGIDFDAMLPLGFLFVDIVLGILLITGMFFLRGILKLLKHVSKEEALASERLTEEM